MRTHAEDREDTRFRPAVVDVMRYRLCGLLWKSTTATARWKIRRWSAAWPRGASRRRLPAFQSSAPRGHRPPAKSAEAHGRVKAAVNSGDPSYFGGWLLDNFAALAAALDLDRLVALAWNSTKGSFLDEPARKASRTGRCSRGVNGAQTRRQTPPLRAAALHALLSVRNPPPRSNS